MSEHQHHDDHDHHDDHHRHHGHENDQGLQGALRYLRSARRMWRSEVNTAVIDVVAPVVGERCLDIGAGVGAGATVAARSGASVTAVEPTPFLRRVLTVRRWFQRNRAHLTVADGTAEQLPAADASIDAIWAVNTMHHWVDTAQGVREISRVLRPGGRVLLVDENFADPTHPDFGRWGDDGDDEGHHHGFTMVGAEQMSELFAAAGVDDVEASNRLLAGRPVIAVTLNVSPD